MDRQTDQGSASRATIQSVDELKDWLLKNGVDLSQWGRKSAKTVAHLWRELVTKEVYLQDEPPLRVGSVVRVIIRNGDRILIEAEQTLGGNRRRKRNHPPTEKMKRSETYQAAARRCLREELGLSNQDIELIDATYRKHEEENDSPSYPGLRTLYTIHSIEAKVRGLPETDFWTSEVDEIMPGGTKQHHWVWEISPFGDG